MAEEKEEREEKDRKRGKPAKRTVDKWKKKIWYTIYAPPEFDRKEIGETISSKPELLLGRIATVSAGELANEAKKSHISLIFRVNDVKGNKAYTEVAGHEIKDSYMRRFVRRRGSKVEVVQEEPAKDGVVVKVKSVCLCAKKVTKAKKTAVGKIMRGEVSGFLKETESGKVAGGAVFGNVCMKIFQEARKVCPIKRVEIVKSRIRGGK